MKRIFLLFPFLFFGLLLQAQLKQKLTASMEQFNNDSQLKFATTGLYVVNVSNGEVVFDQQAETGMATASTEKVLTAATAFDILGKDYVYETKFAVLKSPQGNKLYVQTSGDPSFGSWRWQETKDEVIVNKIKTVLKENSITQLQAVIISTNGWGSDDAIPNAWMWEDLGQYYGASAGSLNWRENQFDLIVKSGKEMGSPVTVVKTKPYLFDYKIKSEAVAAGRESGDNSYLFYPSKGQNYGVLKGAISSGKDSFTISGSIYDPVNQFAKTILKEVNGKLPKGKEMVEITDSAYNIKDWIYVHRSPALSKIIYWFLRKSINLYGEALLKTIAREVKGSATTYDGIEIERNHWKNKGIDMEEMHLYDGSGLSPQNRITPRALTTVLAYAKQQSWFTEFYDGIPVYNDMKMKSGTISRVKGYTGYQKSKDGNEYIFTMLINNYNGSEFSLIRKMYKVLDNIK